MFDKCESPRSKRHGVESSPPTNRDTISRSSSFLLAGLRAFKPQPNEAPVHSRRRGSNTNSTRRISLGSDDDEDESGAIVSIATRSRNQTDSDHHRDNNDNTDTDADDTNLTASSSPRRRWRHLPLRFAPKKKTETNPATVMYSISFYPWKMEPRAYYSHPEAAASWVPDTASSRCQICTAAFSLIRRRHHCRLCGHLVCADCSQDRTYLPFAGATPSQHGLIKDGAPQRTCCVCASTLRNMAAQDDPRVKRFTVAVGSTCRRKPTALTASSSSTQSLVEVEVERPSPWLRRTGVALTDSDVEDEEFYSEAQKALKLDNNSPATVHHFPIRLSVTRAEELDDILCARARSRRESRRSQTNERGNSHSTSSRQFVISSTWLDQWLQYVRVDPTSADSCVPSSVLQLSDDAHVHVRRKCRMARPPRPGPVANYNLLDFVNGALVPKIGLQRTRGNDRRGDYRVVSQEVWVAFLNLYGGGPSIQLSLSDDEDPSNRELVSTSSKTRTAASTVTKPEWVITELDDSLPAIAASPPKGAYSAATRHGAARLGEKQGDRKATNRIGNASNSAPSGKRLTSVASMPALIKNTAGRISRLSRSGSVYGSEWVVESRHADVTESTRSRSRSRWKLWENDSRSAREEILFSEEECDPCMSYSDTEPKSRRRTVGDASSSLAAVSAFASAATLARQRSAMSLSRRRAAISSHMNGPASENQ